MSINLHVKAAKTTKSGKTVTRRFCLYQTPGEAYYDEAWLARPLEAYEAWCYSIDAGITHAEYHLERLKAWISEVEAEGYTVEFYWM